MPFTFYVLGTIDRIACLDQIFQPNLSGRPVCRGAIGRNKVICLATFARTCNTGVRSSDQVCRNVLQWYRFRLA
jgi:hypothetical protein